MRRQLSQPSFQNGFARSIGESAAPELWPDHAWVPALGNQGGIFFNFAGVGAASCSSGIWVVDGFSTATQFVMPSSAWFGLQNTPLTYLFSVTPNFDYNVGTNQGLFALWTGSPSHYVTIFYVQATDYFRIVDDRDGAAQNTNSFTFTSNSQLRKKINFSVRFYPGSKVSFSIDDKFFDLSTTQAFTGTTANQSGLCRDGYGTYGEYVVHNLYQYNRVLTDAEVLRSSSDTILPFRLREIQRYWIPSSGTSQAITGAFPYPVGVLTIKIKKQVVGNIPAANAVLVNKITFREDVVGSLPAPSGGLIKKIKKNLLAIVPAISGLLSKKTKTATSGNTPSSSGTIITAWTIRTDVSGSYPAPEGEVSSELNPAHLMRQLYKIIGSGVKKFIGRML